MRSLQIFVSFAPEDQDYYTQLDKHLAALRRKGLISVWTAQKIAPGANRADEIQQNLETADVVLLLISPDFVHSDECMDREVGPALKRHRDSALPVIPIVVRPVDFSDMPFANLPLLPSNARSVNSWDDRDAAWLDVAQGIGSIVKSLRTRCEEVTTRPLRKACLRALVKMQPSDFNRLAEELCDDHIRRRSGRAGEPEASAEKLLAWCEEHSTILNLVEAIERHGGYVHRTSVSR